MFYELGMKTDWNKMHINISNYGSPVSVLQCKILFINLEYGLLLSVLWIQSEDVNVHLLRIQE